MPGKSQIADRIAARGTTRTAALAAVDAVLDEITAALAAGERVTLTGFGTFEAAGRAARTARNPRTGATVDVAATTVARFHPGATLRTRVAGGAGEAAGSVGDLSSLTGLSEPEPVRRTTSSAATDDGASDGARTEESPSDASAGKAKGATAKGAKAKGAKAKGAKGKPADTAAKGEDKAGKRTKTASADEVVKGKKGKKGKSEQKAAKGSAKKAAASAESKGKKSSASGKGRTKKK